MIVVNFKRYLDLKGAVALCKICKWVSEEVKLRVVTAVEVDHLPMCSTIIECWTQRFEPEAKGYTGSLLNHSDYRLGWAQMQQQFDELLSHGKKICICAATADEVNQVSGFGPDYVAYEPPSLIGNRTKSVSTEKGDEVIGAVKAVGSTPLFIGAGIHNANDIRVGKQLGAKGFIVATDVVKAKDPGRELRELAEEFLK